MILISPDMKIIAMTNRGFNAAFDTLLSTKSSKKEDK